METLALVDQVRYTQIYTFIYSRRSGTRAESLPDPVPPKEKSQWLRELLAAQRGTGCAIMDSYVGSTLRVLVQETGHSNGVLTAHSSGSLIVEFPGDPVLSGQFVQVRVTSATNCVLTGELVV